MRRSTEMVVTLDEALEYLRYAQDEAEAFQGVERAIDAAVAYLREIGVDIDRDPTPEPLRQAVLMLVAHFDLNREAVHDQLHELPFGVSCLVAPYRTVVL